MGCMEDEGTLQEGRVMKDAMEVHHGKCRIQCVVAADPYEGLNVSTCQPELHQSFSQPYG